MEIYIDALESISPQPTFDTDGFLEEIVDPEGKYFSCIKPEYKQYISPKLMRRMSTVIRNGVASAIVCLKQAGIDNPDAIIIGTSLGCVADTVKFLVQIQENNESLLNPTAFIQSTHNTVSGQIALLLGCKSPNLTYTQNTLSFETALTDGMMMLADNQAEHLLVGGIDEITPESNQLLAQTCCMSNISGKNSKVFGEGASFFVLSNKQSDKNVARLMGVRTGNKPLTADYIVAELANFLRTHGLEPEDVDVLVSGDNGNAKNGELYQTVAEALPQADVARYKHLVGEYDTASAFATWLATKILKTQHLPEAVCNSAKNRTIRNALVFNCRKARHHSFMLLSVC